MLGYLASRKSEKDVKRHRKEDFGMLTDLLDDNIRESLIFPYISGDSPQPDPKDPYVEEDISVTI